MATKKTYYYRDFNIINHTNVNHDVGVKRVSKDLYPVRAKTTNAKQDRNLNTINVFEEKSKNKVPFENVMLSIKEKREYDPLLETKSKSKSEANLTVKPRLFNASSLDWDFISFAKRKELP